MHYAELDQAWAELTAPGAQYEVVEVEVDGQRLRAYRNAPATVRALWLSTASFPEREYLIYQDERITYGEAHRRVAAIANWLIARGVRPGDRVAISMRNYPEWLLVYWAAACIGAASVGMNAWWTAAEMAYGLGDSQPKVLFADRERVERLMEQPGMLGDAILVGVRAEALPPGAVPMADVLAEGGELPDIEVDPDAAVCIFYTSGTTGFPKGAELTHRSCLTNLLNLAFARDVQALATLKAKGEAPPQTPPAPPTTLATTPLFHVTANNCGAYPTTAAGGKFVLMYRWDPAEALRLIERERVTNMSGVPVMSRELIAHPDFAKHDTSSLLAVGGGGAQLLPDLVLKIDQTFSGARPTTGYGMTETSGIITSINGDFFIDKPASCGRVMPTFEARIESDSGEILGLRQTGELCVRGAAVIKGYINRPDATAEAIRDGWMHTGDLAYIDEDGFVFVVDRKKDMVLRGGENIYCAEVEAAIHRHEAVAECCVFGAPDPRLGEEVAAAIVLRADQALSPDDLRAHCAKLIARHKIPRYLWLLDQPLPRNASGKFLKRELRESLKLSEAG